MDLASLFPILQAALGIGLVIFVHELGHFVAARMSGVRVEVFSIGMGPRIFSWVRGATRYQLSWIPIGGYVRMAGEERRADGLPPRPDDLSAKSVGVRFIVYSGGVLMNVVFGLVVFPIVFYFGVQLDRPVLDPIPGGQAWRAGVQNGSEVLEIEGTEIFDFLHIATVVALGEEDSVSFRIRDNETTHDVRIKPRKDESFGMRTIDARSSPARGPDGSLELEIEQDSPAWKAGIRSTDRLAGVTGGQPGLTPLHQYAIATGLGEPVELEIVNDLGEPRTVRVVPEDGPDAPLRVGILPPRNHVVGVRDSLVNRIPLRDDDRLSTVNGSPIRRLGDMGAALLAAVETATPATVELAVNRDQVPMVMHMEVASREDALLVADGIALEIDIATPTIIVNPGEPAALAGVQDGDVIRKIEGPEGPVEILAWDDTFSMIRAVTEEGSDVQLHLERDGQHVQVDVSAQGIPIPNYGLAFERSQHIYKADGVLDAISVGSVCSLRFAQETFLMLNRLLTRDVDLKDAAGGPISIGAISYSFAKSGWTKLFFFLCLLSINLAILNILPIPLLDGGHLAFLIVEMIKGSPVSEKVLVYSQMVGLVMILSLLIFLTYNDIARWFLPS